SRRIGSGRLQIPCKCRPAGAGTVSGLFRLGAVNVQDLDRRGLGQHLAERIHPIAGLLARSDALVAKLVELIELLQFDLELQCRAVAMAAGQRHQHAGVEPVRAGGLDLAADEIEGALAVDRQHAIGKSGGVLRVYHRGRPASMSIHEEGTNSTEIPMMGVFNNLVVYDQHIAQNSLATIRPELADSWSWSEDGKALTFKLRPGVKWHD